MAPAHRIATVTRSLVRIPGNGSDTGARPLCLNLARTLTNTDGPLGPLVQESLVQNGEVFVPLVAPLSSPESRPSPRPPAAVQPSQIPQSGKRAREDTEGEGRKRACGAGSPNGPTAVVRKYLDVRVSGSGSSTTTGVSASSTDSTTENRQPTGDVSVDSGNSAGAETPRKTLIPVSAVSQLVETIQDLEKRREESEREKQQLKEEVELLNKKLATFREIFQDTGKLRAVLKRLNITL